MSRTVIIVLLTFALFLLAGCSDPVGTPIDEDKTILNENFHMFPGNGTRSLPTTVTLHWYYDYADEDTRYNLYFADSENPRTLLGNALLDGTAIIEGLDQFTTYFWRIEAVDSEGTLIEKSSDYRFSTIAEDYIVSFPDTLLERAVRDAISLPEGSILTSYINDLMELDANGYGIIELNNIDLMPALRVVDLGMNEVTDLTPLEDNLSIATLTLAGNPLVDLSPLSSIANLFTLDVSQLANAQWDSLSGLTQIRRLYASQNGSDLTIHVSQMDWLKALTLDHNELTDADWASNLTSLEELSIEGNEISDLTPLSGLTELWTLDASLNDISDLTPLSTLTKMDHLKLGGNAITDMSPLLTMTNLTWLELQDNQIAGLPTQMTDWGLSLQLLRISDNPLDPETHNRFGALTALEYLIANNVGLTNLDALSGTPNLIWLEAAGNAIDDISALGELENLVLIDLTDNQIDDITALALPEWMSRLYLDNNQIQDLSALVVNTFFADGDTLSITGNPLSDEAINEDIPDLIERGVVVNF